MPLRSNDTIIFVYNADSGMFNLLADMAHKLLSPQTYECQLCMLTHGHFGMREQWKNYLDTLNVEFTFLHRDEFFQQFGEHEAELPALFIQREGETRLLLPASVIAETEELQILIEEMDKRIQALPD